ncbi:hypothetical protein [Dyella telluris]|uniref:Uncharacterized protein n=1 Tax=Dyella telluris TaxID=2763498 RepID=A0A7G8Q3M0_9GAMM|nr:hypothetical protein [Dyella telluris]QNK01378.1 hypothetical protein H8F01_20450 [Dyella telluris]
MREDELVQAEQWVNEWHIRAKIEAWPDSDTIIQALGPGPVDLRALRASGKLLGVWFKHERRFRYPPWQLSMGRLHPQLSDLLDALAANPAMTPEADPNGWLRLQWLVTPRPSLSELALADQAASDGVAEDSEDLSDDGRSPADVFKIDSSAAVALARSDAAWMSSS